MSLAERVQTILDIESGASPNPFNCVWEEPGGPRGKNMTAFEMDLRDWGMTFGLA